MSDSGSCQDGTFGQGAAGQDGVGHRGSTTAACGIAHCGRIGTESARSPLDENRCLTPLSPSTARRAPSGLAAIPSGDTLSRGVSDDGACRGARRRARRGNHEDPTLDRREASRRERPHAAARCTTPRSASRSGAVDLASMEEIDAAVRNAAEAWQSWRTVSLAKRAELFFRIRELFHAHREDLARLLTAEHGKVLSDAMGEVARGLEVIEFACGIPTLLKGEFSEQASTGIDVYSIRQPLGVVAGITPFNFPAMVPMWMWAPAIACGNTLHPEALREGPVGVAADGRAPQGGRAAGRRLQRRPRRQGRGRRAARAPGHRRGQLRRLDPDRAVHLRDRDEARQARAGARRREEPHGRAARCRRRHGGRRRRLGAATAPRASAAWRSRSLVAVGDVADPLVAAIKERLPKVKVGNGLEPDIRDGAARHARAPRQGRVVHRRPGRSRARRSSRTAARPHRTATASSSACRCSTTSRRRWTPTGTRSSGPSSRSSGRRDL